MNQDANFSSDMAGDGKPSDFHREIDRLVVALASDAATDADRERVCQLISENPAARRRYLRGMALVASLEWGVATGETGLRGCELNLDGPNAAAESSLSPASQTLDHKPVLGFPARLSGAFHRPITWSVLAVGVLFAAYFVAISWNMLGRERHDRITASHKHDATKSETRNQQSEIDSVATITGSEVAKWEGKSEIGNPKSEILQGQPLSLQSGLVELKLKQGTTLLIEGPAEWSIDGKNRATLKRGKLVAKVPQQAIGFTLETPTAKIVDLSTEFAIAANEEGDTEVQVFRGRVSLQPISHSTSLAPQSVTLHTGEARLIERTVADTVEISNVSAARNLFTRNLRSKVQLRALQVLFQDVVGHWTFDEGLGTIAHDYSGRGMHAAMIGMSNDAWVQGKLGNAIRFAGNNANPPAKGEVQALRLPNSLTLDALQEHDFTLMAWVRPANYPASPATDISLQANDLSYAVILKREPKGYRSCGLRLRGDRLIYAQRFGDPASESLAISQDSFEPDVWMHLAQVVSMRRQTLDLFVNGQLASSVPFSADQRVLFYQAPWMVGVSDPQATNKRWAMNGDIDDVRIYATALDETLIRAIAFPHELQELVARYETAGAKLVPATGKVTLAGRPLAGVPVLFRCESHSWVAYGTTDGAGSFSLHTVNSAGAVPGHYQVYVLARHTGAADSATARPIKEVDLMDKQSYFEFSLAP